MIRRIIQGLGISAVFMLALLQATTRPEAGETQPVLVFAAASLKTSLDKIGSLWTENTGKRATFSYAASSALAKQIEQGAPADIYASADIAWMNALSGKKLVVPDTRVDLLGNTLVLIAPAGSPAALKIERGFPLAPALGDGRLATGDPKSVPAGAYAEAALKSLGVWEAVAPRVAGAENVRAALAFVARNEAPFGIVYGSDAKSEPRVKVVGTFPADTHPPIVYPFAITASSANPDAREFLDFLGSETASAVFVADGFTFLPRGEPR